MKREMRAQNNKFARVYLVRKSMRISPPLLLPGWLVRIGKLEQLGSSPKAEAKQESEMEAEVEAAKWRRN